jgi:molybdenum cofactor cytidylyltransferase
VVVLGAHAGPVAAALEGLDLTLVENPEYAVGLSTSLKAGLAALPPETQAALVLLGDMPRIGAAHLDGLIAAYRAAEPRPSAVVPVRDQRRGNPVLLDLRVLKDDFEALSGDRGAGPILNRRTDVLEVPGDAATGFDVDRPDGLAVDLARAQPAGNRTRALPTEEVPWLDSSILPTAGPPARSGGTA